MRRLQILCLALVLQLLFNTAVHARWHETYAESVARYEAGGWKKSRTTHDVAENDPGTDRFKISSRDGKTAATEITWEKDYDDPKPTDVIRITQIFATDEESPDTPLDSFKCEIIGYTFRDGSKTTSTYRKAFGAQILGAEVSELQMPSVGVVDNLEWEYNPDGGSGLGPEDVRAIWVDGKELRLLHIKYPFLLIAIEKQKILNAQNAATEGVELDVKSSGL